MAYWVTHVGISGVESLLLGQMWMIFVEVSL